MKELLIKLASLLQAAKLQSHSFHHNCSRVAFFQDHAEFAALYEAYDTHFDSIVERCIGMHGDPIQLPVILQQVVAELSNIPQQPDNTSMYKVVLQLDMKIQALSEQICKLPDIREAEKQLLGELSNQCAIRQYKIKQRTRQ